MSLATMPTERSSTTRIAPGTHHQQLSRLRDRERRRRTMVVALSGVSLLILLLALLGVVDYHFETSITIRVIGWASILAVVAVVVARSPSWRRLESTSALARLERTWPDLGQRLRTSHDYQTNSNHVAPADPQLIRALEAETQQRVTRREFAPLGSRGPIIALIGLCALTILVWATALIAVPEWRVATARLLLVPVHYSSVQMEPIPESVPFGEDLVLQLHVDGRPLKAALLRYRVAGSADWNELALQPSTGSGSIDDLSAVVRDCRDDLEVRVIAGPFDSDVQRVDVRIPLVLEAWAATVKPPSYTGLPSTTGTPTGMRIPEGSVLSLTATYNRVPSKLDVELAPQPTATAETFIYNNTANIHFAVAAQPMDVAIRGRTEDGMTDDSTLHIHVVPDQRPSLKFVTPDESAEAIPTAEVRFTLQSFDDYGLSSVGIRYRIDDGPERTLWESASDEASTAVVETATLALEDLDIAYPQAITYYAYAIDNRQPEPQRVTSELRFIDIRPFSREYEFVENKCSGNCQGECLTLEKLIKLQREILARTFAAVQQGTESEEVGNKLADEERELREKTHALTEALLEKVGPMPLLTMSLQAMSDAISELADAAINAGQAHEERALADLIAARQNLRTILKQSDSKAQMCRNVDQQQLDKIRTPEKEQAQEQEQQLASIREKLEKIARKQQSFCKSASENTPARDELAKQQQQSAAEAEAIKKEIESGKFGSLAPKRIGEAAELINDSGELISQGEDDAQSIALAEEAAQRLRQLSNHLARRHEPDFGKKLAAAGRQAEKLANEQASLSEELQQDGHKDSGPGGDEAKEDQQKLANRGEELADLVDQLTTDAADQDWQLERALAEQIATASPRHAADEMQRAAEALKQKQTAAASNSGRRGSDTLSRFAAGVKQVQQAMGPVRLAELKKAEQQAASLLKELGRADSPAEKAMVDAKARQFAQSMAPLARDEPKLAEALESLPQFSNTPSVLDEALRNIDEVLQHRIQEAILSGNLQQAVGAVPPQYTDMVEEYYRVLSEDTE